MTSQKEQIRLSDIIAPAFYELHWDIVERRFTHFRLPGGRGSGKSTDCGSEIPLNMMEDADRGLMSNAIVFRRNAVDLHDSVFEQVKWGIDALGVSHLWKETVSPMKLTYKPTGQVILFKGADKVTKRKSIKVSKGYIKYLWFEELDEFEGPEKIRSIRQSVVRGGEEFIVFYSYNPPKSVNSWVNDETQWNRPDTKTYHSTYLTVPRQWLGEQFILEAEHLKKTNPEAYRHEYLGEVTGTGGEVFKNVKLRRITDEEIRLFYIKRRGLDEGYATDPLAYLEMAYDRKYRRLYIFGEVYGAGISNRKAFEEISRLNKLNDVVYCDCAASRFINEMRQHGLRIVPVKKGPDSVEYGIKFLQDLEEIIIDDGRCPNAAREFTRYELGKDANGNFRAEFPDRDNHTIDAARYGLNYECLKWRDEAKKKKPHYNFESEKPKPSALGTVTEDFFKGGW